MAPTFKPASWPDFEVLKSDGQPLPLRTLLGQVVLVVNTASACGFTPQLASLQALYTRYAAQGLVILAFPCHQFGQQAPGSSQDQADFCVTNYGVGFPVMSKVDVKGAQAHPFFQWLTQQAPGVLGTRAIKWNFTKFLINRQGQVVHRYAPITPVSKLEPDVRAALLERTEV